jgi:hypothetical protein
MRNQGCAGQFTRRTAVKVSACIFYQSRAEMHTSLLLVLGMAFLVAGIRRSELEFQQTAAQLNTSVSLILTLFMLDY